MRPALIYDILADMIDDERVFESQSLDTRPFNEGGIFIVVSMEEQSYGGNVMRRGPQICTIATHQNWNEKRDYNPHHDLHNLMKKYFMAVAGDVGSDGVRVTEVRPQGRSANVTDEGWETITVFATYGVLYDQSAP
jgi:hypothetical protein